MEPSWLQRVEGSARNAFSFQIDLFLVERTVGMEAMDGAFRMNTPF
jgi:hypothetical protein